ncbi:hypothetical protein [Jeotgalibacillus soli]|uniref:Uncharacterized protein n=1 Tax=Jeotgalibacillus soli TaxID=889306 RepID=A0A0C2RHM4_9BACL|nr:hypothetical protein [Jeotgalibacillus soli]KIL49675.1 hypothetical protein KP78_11430 [Jeotgalibacillus soli]
MFNFIIAIAVGIGLFIGFWLITESIGIALGAGVVGLIIAIIAVSFYTGQRQQQIKQNKEAPLNKDRTPESVNNEGYNPEKRKKERIEDPTN